MSYVYKCSKCGYVSTEIGAYTCHSTENYWGAPVSVADTENYCLSCGSEYIEEIYVPSEQEIFDDGEWHKVYGCNDDCIECLEARAYEECTQPCKMTAEELLLHLTEDMEMDKQAIEMYYEKHHIKEQLDVA